MELKIGGRYIPRDEPLVSYVEILRKKYSKFIGKLILIDGSTVSYRSEFNWNKNGRMYTDKLSYLDLVEEIQ